MQHVDLMHRNDLNHLLMKFVLSSEAILLGRELIEQQAAKSWTACIYEKGGGLSLEKKKACSI